MAKININADDIIITSEGTMEVPYDSVSDSITSDISNVPEGGNISLSDIISGGDEVRIDTNGETWEIDSGENPTVTIPAGVEFDGSISSEGGTVIMESGSTVTGNVEAASFEAKDECTVGGYVSVEEYEETENGVEIGDRFTAGGLYAELEEKSVFVGDDASIRSINVTATDVSIGDNCTAGPIEAHANDGGVLIGNNVTADTITTDSSNGTYIGDNATIEQWKESGYTATTTDYFGKEEEFIIIGAVIAEGPLHIGDNANIGNVVSVNNLGDLEAPANVGITQITSNDEEYKVEQGTADRLNAEPEPIELTITGEPVENENGDLIISLSPEEAEKFFSSTNIPDEVLESFGVVTGHENDEGTDVNLTAVEKEYAQLFDADVEDMKFEFVQMPAEESPVTAEEVKNEIVENVTDDKPTADPTVTPAEDTPADEDGDPNEEDNIEETGNGASGIDDDGDDW